MASIEFKTYDKTYEFAGVGGNKMVKMVGNFEVQRLGSLEKNV